VCKHCQLAFECSLREEGRTIQPSSARPSLSVDLVSIGPRGVLRVFSRCDQIVYGIGSKYSSQCETKR
jgi:hypothetical protein